MDEEKIMLEKEKLRLENKKIKRDLNSGIEKKKLEIESRRQKKENTRAWVGILVPVLSTITTIYIASISLTSNREANARTARQNDLARIDRLEVEFHDPKTIQERKARIAHHLLNVADTTLLSDFDRQFYADFYSIYYKTVSEATNDTKSSNKKIDTQEKKLKPEDSLKLISAEKRQVLLENKLAKAKDPEQKVQLKGEIQDISSSLNTSTRQAATLLDSLSKTQLELTKFEKGTSNSQQEVTWFKEGYYRPLGDNLILTLSNLDARKRSGVVTVSKIAGEGFEELQRITFSVPGKKTFVHGSDSYEIDFVRIDRAGKNPFTKAVYYSASKHTKTFDETFDDTFQ